MELTNISLFTGIGGIDLAAEWAGFKTILMVENNLYCQKVLNKHWPDVPIIGDIKDVTKEKVMAYAKNWQQSQLPESDNTSNSQERYESRTGDRSGSGNIASGTRNRRRVTEAVSSTAEILPITLITGGFPCQPVSQAGKQRGKEDDRWLWPEMLRVITEVRPEWVLAENVAGLIRMGLSDCLSDLERAGYITETFLIPACAVNAPHRRDRIFIVANASWRGEESGAEGRAPDKSSKDMAHSQGSRIRQELTGVASDLLSEDGASQEFKSSSRHGSKPQEQRLEGAKSEGATQTSGCPTEYIGSNWWAVEPELGRVAYGVPNRVDRLRCLGNAVVPQQIYPILKAIADIELS